jgi:cell division protein FtsB
MSAAGSYPRWIVTSRRAAPTDGSRQSDRSAARDPAPGDVSPVADVGEAAEPGDAGALGGGPDRIDLGSLSIAGITRRQVGWVAASLLAVWVVIVFARQVGDATSAANRAVQLAADNAALAAEVDALEDEVALIVRPEYVAIAARGHRLGADREIPFALDPSVPAPVDGSPGSASVRLGAQVDRQTPLESWLSLLFGPSS